MAATDVRMMSRYKDRKRAINEKEGSSRYAPDSLNLGWPVNPLTGTTRPHNVNWSPCSTTASKFRASRKTCRCFFSSGN